MENIGDWEFEKIVEFVPDAGWVHGIEFTPDGKYLAGDSAMARSNCGMLTATSWNSPLALIRLEEITISTSQLMGQN